MSDGEIHELSRVVGGLETSIENFKATWREQDRKATESRRELYKEMTKLRVEFGQMQQRIEPLTALQNRVDVLTAAKHQAQGAVWMARLIFGVLCGVVGALIAKLVPGR